MQTTFSSSLAHIIAHPAALLKHIATEYLTPPPPASPEVKFWGVFLPLSVRTHEAERLVFGNNGEGSGDSEEIVIEVLVRCSGKKRVVQRALEGWSINNGVSCELTALEGVRSLWGRQTVFEVQSTQRILRPRIAPILCIDTSRRPHAESVFQPQFDFISAGVSSSSPFAIRTRR